MPRVDGVVGVSRATLEAVRSHYGLAEIPAACLPRGVDPAELEPGRSPAQVRSELDTPPEAPVAIFVGSLSPEKRLDRLLDWVDGARRSHPNLVLWILGEGPWRGRIERSVQERGGAEQVVFVGLQERVGDYLAASDLLLLSSDTEGMPGVVIEAAMCGVPSVATEVGGVAECIQHEVTGVLVSPDDPAAGARAVSQLLTEEAWRSRMGEAARRFALERFHIDEVAEGYVAFYRRVLERRRQP